MSNKESVLFCFVSFPLYAKYAIRDFSKRSVLYLNFTFYIFFSSIFLSLNDVFTLIKICSICLALKNYIVYNAYSGQTLSLRSNLE